VSLLQNGGAAPAAAADAVIDTTTQTFMKDVIEESRRQPVLVDFWAPWCGPCKQLTPVLEKVVRAAKGKVKLAKMDIDKHPEIPGQMGIQSIPAVIAFVNGQPADGFMGALPEGQVTAFLERLLKDRIGGEEKDLLKSADDALAAKDFTGAAERYAQALAADNTNVAALAGLARSYLGTGAIDQATIDLAEQAKSVGPVDDLQAKVAADPADHQARYDLAVALNANGQREAAADHLIEIVKRDRKWNEDAARKQLVQLFEAWGPADEATVSGRRRLSSILFS